LTREAVVFLYRTCSDLWRSTRDWRLLGVALAMLAGAATLVGQQPWPSAAPDYRQLQTQLPAGSTVALGDTASGRLAAREPIHLAQQPQPPQPQQVPGVPQLQQPQLAPAAPTNGPPPVGRLELLPPLPAGLEPPVPTEATRQLYDKFLQRTVDPQVRLDLIIGHPRILVFAETPKRIYLPDEQTAVYQVISDTEISLVGIRPGTTVLNVWVADPDAPKGERILSYLITVVPPPRQREELDARYHALQKEINQAFPCSTVELSLIGDRLVVRGMAKDAIEASHILSIVAQHSPRQATDPFGQDVQIVQQVAGFEEIDPLLQGEDSALRRSVVDPQALARAGIVNLLQIPGEQQVMLRVTVAEVNRTAARSIGLNFSIENDNGVTVFQSLTGNLAQGGGGAGGLANVLASLDNGQVLLAINALRTLKLAKTLAEPNLVTLNGHPANFQAGGRFPVPIIGGFTNNGLQGVAFVPFGVQLNFTPYVVDRDRVRLSVNAEVSTRDEALGTNIGGGAGGTQVSGLSTRNFTTTVELREGQTLAVAGLIQNNFGSDTDRVPFWGDLPLIGPTGGFNRTSSGEQELVILITPELVHPLEACETPNIPGSDVFEPGDLEFYLGNRLESRRSRDWRASVRTDYARIRAGDKFCEDRLIIGPAGPTYGCCNLGSHGGHAACVNCPPAAMPPESIPAPAPLPAPVLDYQR
jgi:pilus assembly protein CpaC